MKKRIRSIIIALTVVVTWTAPVGAVPNVDKMKQERDATQGSLNRISQQISGLESSKQAVNEEIEEINGELVDILTSIGVCQSEIEVKEKEIDEVSVKLTKAEEDEKEQYESMKKRVRFLYEKGGSAYMQTLIESKGYTDLVNKADYVEKLYDYDHELLEQYVTVKQQVSDLKDHLEEEQAGLEASRYELGQEQSRLEEMITEKKKTVEDFDAQLAAARVVAGTMQKQLEEQTAQIKAAEEAKRKEAEAKRKKQEEEARKKAEAQAQKNNKQQTGETTNVDSNTGDKDLEQVDINTGEEELSAGAGAEVIDSAGSSRGRDVVNYACQFVGNPYVFGGTSLTNGTDCSGFVQAVYSHFGISLPRDSTSQRSVGVGVSYDQAQPGDIICYAGHVALYMGNGSIVHASTERTGITYGSATYRTIITIRRVL